MYVQLCHVNSTVNKVEMIRNKKYFYCSSVFTAATFHFILTSLILYVEVLIQVLPFKVKYC